MFFNLKYANLDHMKMMTKKNQNTSCERLAELLLLLKESHGEKTESGV